MKENLKSIGFFLIAIICFFNLQFFSNQIFDFGADGKLIVKLYAVIGGLTFLMVIIALVVKHYNQHHVGSVFLAGMIAKMAIVLALVVVNQEFKSNIYQLIVAYFLILLAEVLTFVKILKNKA